MTQETQDQPFTDQGVIIDYKNVDEVALRVGDYGRLIDLEATVPCMLVFHVRFSMSLPACRIAQAQGGLIEIAFMIIQRISRLVLLSARGDS